jgi:hypothetical protein
LVWLNHRNKEVKCGYRCMAQVFLFLCKITNATQFGLHFCFLQ